jgi:SAM-dependent methyltransferase
VPRVLEIGGGTGLFAKAALDDGLDIELIEPGARFSDAHALLGGRASRLAWEERLSSDSTGAWDVIVAWEVIEHLLDPKAFVRAAAYALRPGGALILSTPNAESWSVRLLRASDPMLCPDEHLRLFSKKGLSALMFGEGSGLTIRGFGFLLADEVRAGMAKMTPVSLPVTVAKWASVATRMLQHSGLSLGLEAVLKRNEECG